MERIAVFIQQQFVRNIGLSAFLWFMLARVGLFIPTVSSAENVISKQLTKPEIILLDKTSASSSRVVDGCQNISEHHQRAPSGQQLSSAVRC